MLKRLFLLPLRAKLPPLLMLRPNLPSLPFLSRALRNSSDVDGRRSFDAAFRRFGSVATAATATKAVPEPLLLPNIWLDFFETSPPLPFGVFLLRMSDVEERRGLTEIDRYGEGLAERGTYSWYCKSALVDDVVGVTAGVAEADDDDGYR